MYTLELCFTDHTYNRTYGIFTTLEKAQNFVKDALGVEAKWSDPSKTVKGTVVSTVMCGLLESSPNRVGRFRIDRFPVDPTEYSTDLRYGLVD